MLRFSPPQDVVSSLTGIASITYTYRSRCRWRSLAPCRPSCLLDTGKMTEATPLSPVGYSAVATISPRQSAWHTLPSSWMAKLDPPRQLEVERLGATQWKHRSLASDLVRVAAPDPSHWMTLLCVQLKQWIPGLHSLADTFQITVGRRIEVQSLYSSASACG